MSLGVGGFSWPFRLALNNHVFMRLLKVATPQCERVICKESSSVHQKSIGPPPANAETYSSDLSIHCEYDQQLFVCHKHIQEEEGDEGGTDTKKGEETFDDSKDSGQALSLHMLEDSDTSEHDSEEEEDDEWESFDPIQPADSGLEENTSIYSILIGGDDDEDDEDNDFIVFSNNPEAVDTKPVCNRASEDTPPQPRSLVHTVSYSSDESGFCEIITDSSDEESEDSESEDDEVSVVFDEGLWQEMEQQVHFFVGIRPPSKPTVSRQKSALKPSVLPHRSVSPKPFIENTTVATNADHQVQKNTCIFVPMGDCETRNTENTTAHASAPELYCSQSSPKTRKSVSFKPDSELVKVHLMVKWQYAYRACRGGPWEQMARDRDRFRARIEHTAKILNPCLRKHPSRQM